MKNRVAGNVVWKKDVG